MSSHNTSSGHASRGFRLGAVMATLVTGLALAPTGLHAATASAHAARADLRTKDMHTRLGITAAQEPKWALVAASLRDNAERMDALTQARGTREGNMTAVDDLESYGAIAQAHAAGVKNLLPKFAALYASMSDAQKLAADTLFRDGEQGRRRDNKSAVLPIVK